MGLDAVKINLFLLPGGAGGATNIAYQDHALAYGAHVPPKTVEDLIANRDVIEKSLKDNEDRPTAAQLQAFGVDISRILFPGDLSSLYFAASAGERLIQITLNTADEQLKKVPWEYVVWPDVKEGPHATRTFARSVAVPNGSERTPKSISGSLIKILLIGADVLGRDRIPWTETKENLERILGARLQGPSASRISLNLVEGATKASVREALDGQQYDVVHFVGHGRPNGIFLRGDDNPKGEVLTTAAFSQMVVEAKPALVILSACETAMIGDIAPLGTIAETLVTSGVPAVVANQMPISVGSIADFTGAVYRSLLTDGNIDVAVNKGRMELVKEIEALKWAAVEWGIPVLYRRPGCSQLFTP